MGKIHETNSQILDFQQNFYKMKTKFIYRGLTIRLSRKWFGWRAEIDWPSAVQVIDTVDSAKHVLKCAKDQIKLSFKIAEGQK